MKEVSPCMNCSRVKDPGNCENKCCRQWSAWFMQRWSQIHGFYQKYGKQEDGK